LESEIADESLRALGEPPGPEIRRKPARFRFRLHKMFTAPVRCPVKPGRQRLAVARTKKECVPSPRKVICSPHCVTEDQATPACRRFVDHEPPVLLERRKHQDAGPVEPLDKLCGLNEILDLDPRVIREIRALWTAPTKP